MCITVFVRQKLNVILTLDICVELLDVNICEMSRIYLLIS